MGPSSRWREKWGSLANQNAKNTCDLFTQIYQSQLERHLGYKVFTHKLIRSQKSPLHRLIYASKDERGLDFWRKIESKDKGGQRRLF